MVFHIFMVYLHVILHMTSFIVSLIIISLIVKINVFMVAMMLFHIQEMFAW